MTPIDVTVDLEFTPNPNTLKYVTNLTLLETGAANFREAAAAQGLSEIATKLFALDGIAGVMVGKNFVTVTLADQDKLTELNEQIIDTIKGHLSTGAPALDAAAWKESQKTTSHSASAGDAESLIIKILNDEIRPAVAMDGGDITFEKYEDGVVYLHMQGSCAGCPSSTATLKMGIENRLKDAIPGLIEVVAV